MLLNDEFHPVMNIPGHKKWKRGGYCFETFGELCVADLLLAMKMPFLHHVEFKTSVGIWHPDFVFDRLYKWEEAEDGQRAGIPIIGIEVKKRSGSSKKLRNALLSEKGLRVKYLYHGEVYRYRQQGYLPLGAMK